MSDQRLLADNMDIAPGWHVVAQEVLRGSVGFDDHCDYHGRQLAALVLNGEIDGSELKIGTAWADALDRDAEERIAGAFEELGSEDQIEAVARRLAYQAGRKALLQLEVISTPVGTT